ncbi:MAG: hypothetical protein Q8M06_00295 [Methanobacteriaceae archaeon]|jgi:hypothetical protein|nr:hypothetical protein [Methanobacteriaceae archaeon]MDZ4171980.1 hypothetical protein [Methanobacteriaceae archaeon]
MHVNIKKAFGFGNNIFSKGNSPSYSSKRAVHLTNKKENSTWNSVEKQVFEYAFSDKFGLIRKLSIKFNLKNPLEISEYLLNNTELITILSEVYHIIRTKFNDEELSLELISDDYSDIKYLILCIISSSSSEEILPKLTIVEDNILELDYDNMDKPLIDVEFQ